MTTKSILPNMPQTAFFDPNGSISRIWQAFFRSLHVRIGGDEQLSNSQIVEVLEAILAIINPLALVANRIVATDGDEALVSISSLSAWIAGTGDQVTISDDGDGTITISLPQDIATASSVAFGSVELDGHLVDRLFEYRTVTGAAYDVVATDGTIFVDATSNDITISHITAVGFGGAEIIFKRIDNTENTVTKNADGAEEIDSESSFTLYGMESINTRSDNSNWWII